MGAGCVRGPQRASGARGDRESRTGSRRQEPSAPAGLYRDYRAIPHGAIGYRFFNTVLRFTVFTINSASRNISAFASVKLLRGELRGPPARAWLRGSRSEGPRTRSSGCGQRATGRVRHEPSARSQALPPGAALPLDKSQTRAFSNLLLCKSETGAHLREFLSGRKTTLWKAWRECFGNRHATDARGYHVW